MRVLAVIMQQAVMASYQLPMGIGYISASLKQAGHDVHVLNPNHSTDDLKTQLIQAINKYDPQVLSVGGMSFHMQQIQRIIVTARPLLANSIIIIGGVAVSNHPEVTMSALADADIGVVGEGEKTIVELINALETGSKLNDVNGIIYWGDDRKLIQTGPRPIEKDLDSLPWVDWEGIGLDVYAGLHKPGELAPGLIVDSDARAMTFLTSRGCPFTCTFCCHELLGRQYRTRSMDDVLAELEFAIDRFAINTVAIFDDVFSLKRQRLHEFCERVRPLDLRWECSLRVEQITADNLKLMHDSGCVCISFGVESMSPTVLKSMQKSTTKEILDNALNLIYESKITTWANLIFGDPAETTKTAKETLDWWAQNNHMDLRTAFIGYHPGSRIYEDALQKGLIKNPKEFLLSNKPEINGTAMSDEEYNELRIETVPIYILSFGFPGRILKLSHKSDGYCFDLECICPHCGEELSYNDIALNPKSVNRLSCRHCAQLYRVPIRFRNASSKAVKHLHEKLQDLLPSQLSDIPTSIACEIFNLCQEINNIDPGNNKTWNIMLEILDSVDRYADAIEILKAAIAANPYEPNLFDQMDTRLAKMGWHDEREKYTRQASILRKIGITSPVDIDTLAIG